MMEEKIQKLYESYSERRGSLVQRLQALTSEVVVMRPAEGQWSIAEVAQHLALVEDKLFGVAKEGLSKEGNKKRPGLIQAIKINLMFCLLRTKIRVKVPAKAVIPSAEVTPADSLEIWGRLEKEWAELLNSMSLEQAKLSIVQHPVAGWMNMQQLLKFLSVHLDHHLPQIERTLFQVSAKLDQS
jgi:uncharacterized damage-inducible protein DinB